MFKANSIHKAWENLSKVLNPSGISDDLNSFLKDFSISNTISHTISHPEEKKYNKKHAATLSVSATIERPNEQRVHSSMSANRSYIQSISNSVEFTNMSTITHKDVIINTRLKVKQQKLNQTFIRSIPLQKLISFYQNKCRDNDIQATKYKCTQFLNLINKRGEKRILDLSNFQLGQSCSLFVAEILTTNNHFLQLIMQGNNLTESGWIIFADILKHGHNNTLLHLDLSKCCMSPLSFVNILPSLICIKSLISLNLSSNHLSKVGCEMLELFLHKNQTLLYLNISSTQIGLGYQSVFRGISLCKTLVSLDFGNNDMANKNMKLFTSSILLYKDYDVDFLMQLNLEKNNLCQKGAAQLALMMKWKNWKLQTLNLSSNRINSKGFQKIVEALINHRFIEKLIISKNNLRGEGFEYIIYLLQSNSSLRLLNLADCQLDTLAAFSVGTALSKNHSLQDINISDNPILWQGAQAIADGIKSHTQINILNISRCQIRDQGASYLFQQIQGLQSIFNLVVKSNFLTDESFVKLKTLLTSNKKLTQVDYSLNSINYELERNIIQSLQDNQNYQKNQIVPKYMKKIFLIGDLQQQEADVSLSQQKLDMKAEIVLYKLNDAKNQNTQVKNEEKQKMQELHSKNDRKQIKLKELIKLNDFHEIEIYRSIKSNEVDIIFYEKNIEAEKNLSKFFQTSITQTKVKSKLMEHQMPIILHELQQKLKQSKIILEKAQDTYQNLQQDVQSILDKLKVNQVVDYKKKIKQKQRNSRSK